MGAACFFLGGSRTFFTPRVVPPHRSLSLPGSQGRHTRREGHGTASIMALLSGLFHESEAALRASEERRYEKYGGEQKIDSMVDLSEETIPGVLMKKIVRPGNGELPPVGSNVSLRVSSPSLMFLSRCEIGGCRQSERQVLK